jgi:hypothetical protein
MKSIPEMAVHAIIDDLSGRKGIGDEWDQIDPDIQDEIIEEWEEHVRSAIASAITPGSMKPV